MTEEDFKMDPLDEIFVESNEVASRKIVAEILKPPLTIDPKGNLDFLASYDKLTNQKKALVYLVAKKAMKMKGSIDEEFTLNAETSKSAMISENDANNAFSNTYKNLVENGKGKGYAIPDYKLKKIKEILFQDG